MQVIGKNFRLVYTYLHADTGLCTSFNKATYFKYSFNKCLEL